MILTICSTLVQLQCLLLYIFPQTPKCIKYGSTGPELVSVYQQLYKKCPSGYNPIGLDFRLLKFLYHTYEFVWCAA